MGKKDDDVSTHDFSDEIKINRFQLEIECERQASTYLYWANRLADAKSSLNDEEDSLKLSIAQTDVDIRASWNDTVQGKQTEGSIKATLETHPDILSGKEKVRKLQREVNTLIGVVSAFDHRKSELDNLTTLLVKGFYSAPNGGKREDGTAVVQREVREKLNEKKSKKAK